MSKLRNSNIQAVACVGEEEAKHGDNSTIEAGDRMEDVTSDEHCHA